MGYNNMIFDVMILNMENQLTELAHERFGKPFEKCGNAETYHVLMLFTKRILEIGEKNSGEKKVYYISMEYKTGRLLENTLINLGIYERTEEILRKYGKNLRHVAEAEVEPSLGSGGLGSLSAGLMDSIATLGYPAVGIGLHYHFGLFKQVFEDKLQTAQREPWIQRESWEDLKETSFYVAFGRKRVRSVMYEISVAGFKSGINKLRLFDLASVDESLVREGISFDKNAVCKNLTLFLYPDDSDEAGRKLRLYQQYFLVSNAAQMIMLEMKSRKCDLRRMYDYAVIQINDTHPTLIIPELIRILVDEKALSFMEAIHVVTQTCAYTNHAVLNEALETWPIDYLNEVVPQLVPIIHRLDLIIKNRYHDPSVWIIDAERNVHMAHICVHFSFSTNGVAKIHTSILENTRLKGFYNIYPERFSTKTNGISLRRWLMVSNPELTSLISARIGCGFKTDASELETLLDFAHDEETLHELMGLKVMAKERLAEYIRVREGVELLRDGIYDMQVMRIHEYKRQMLNALYVIRRYLEIKRGKRPARPINFIFGGKAASAYILAQDIIHLILVLQEIINSDPEVNPYMRMVMITNYNVTYAEKLAPAADISQQISLASQESSGTGNMKYMLNGAITLSSRDGAGEEICEQAGEENVYLFGKTADEVVRSMETGEYSPEACYRDSAAVREAVDFITGPQMLSAGHRDRLERLAGTLRTTDRYMTLSDFEDYIRIRDKMYEDYEDRTAWTGKMLANIAASGRFSADQTISDYNRDIWKLKSFMTYSEEGK